VDRPLAIACAPSPAIAARDSTRDARFRSMVDAHFAAVWRTLLHLGIPEASADDGAQHVFMVALRRLDEIVQGAERPYLLGVASEARRAARRRREVPTDDGLLESLGSAAAEHSPDPTAAVDQKRALAVLARCLEGLSEKLREAFVLFELEELSAPELAQLLGVSVGTVASRVRLAREEIRRTLGDLGRP
jgi:RNA polymerase sigma-70 factor (ECF subfamily)